MGGKVCRALVVSRVQCDAQFRRQGRDRAALCLMHSAQLLKPPEGFLVVQ
jgi:hypothetical protein